MEGKDEGGGKEGRTGGWVVVLYCALIFCMLGAVFICLNKLIQSCGFKKDKHFHAGVQSLKPRCQL